MCWTIGYDARDGAAYGRFYEIRLTLREEAQQGLGRVAGFRTSTLNPKLLKPYSLGPNPKLYTINLNPTPLNPKTQ